MVEMVEIVKIHEKIFEKVKPEDIPVKVPKKGVFVTFISFNSSEDEGSFNLEGYGNTLEEAVDAVSDNIGEVFKYSFTVEILTGKIFSLSEEYFKSKAHDETFYEAHDEQRELYMKHTDEKIDEFLSLVGKQR